MESELAQWLTDDMIMIQATDPSAQEDDEWHLIILGKGDTVDAREYDIIDMGMCVVAGEVGSMRTIPFVKTNDEILVFMGRWFKGTVA